MSYDYRLLKLRHPVALSALQESDCEPMGDLATVRAVIDRSIPDVTWRTGVALELGYCAGDERLQFEIPLGDDSVTTFVARTSLRSSTPPAPLVNLCRATGWALLDTQAAKFVLEGQDLSI